ncbi:DUF6233 domain-containing protein [Streptomyces sp. DH41]|uniref:DUF6233 domain-containing protein n=1 Tax=Streptomyces sp. DH41 TaxID=3040125 RepID=UPI003014A10A
MGTWPQLREYRAVHAGGCWNAGKRSAGISRDEARRALACSHCRPDTGLRVEG